MSPTSRSKVIAAIVVVVAFLAGIVIGVAGDRVWRFRHGMGRGHAPHMMSALILRRLDHELDLTPQQHNAVKQILDAREQRVNALMANVRPQIRQQIDAANAEIEKVLTPEQRVKFQQMRIRRRGGH